MHQDEIEMHETIRRHELSHNPADYAVGSHCGDCGAVITAADGEIFVKDEDRPDSFYICKACDDTFRYAGQDTPEYFFNVIEQAQKHVNSLDREEDELSTRLREIQRQRTIQIQQAQDAARALRAMDVDFQLSDIHYRREQ